MRRGWQSTPRNSSCPHHLAAPVYPTPQQHPHFMNLCEVAKDSSPVGEALARRAQCGSGSEANGWLATMAVDPLVWLERINMSMDFCPADAFVMSCGTVTLDLARSKVLLIWNKRIQIYQLPKGRRNIDESMLNAAIRETYEETGIRVTPLRLDIATRATPPADEQSNDGANPQVTEGRPSTEFVGACFYPDPQSDKPAFKGVFYFAATADSTANPQRGTQEAWENLDTCWVPIAEAAGKLRFQGEIDAVRKTVEDVRKTGYTIDA
ncbi:NUDIX hydrolase domain-like protein [Echria macrotheca]|uniref:NUDIX hydrolase domain-like protein n=1 Tax=Echria macrotheca TaxID=438768 RepID=A0AAJ0B263_9PEZI|nr:NUDIX hydrolase domain-like protein [Echria macrotheca]